MEGSETECDILWYTSAKSRAGSPALRLFLFLFFGQCKGRPLSVIDDIWIKILIFVTDYALGLWVKVVTFLPNVIYLGNLQ
jgi:hypothetical protein